MDPPDLDMSGIFLFWSFTGLTTKNYIGKIPAPRIIFRYEHENHQKIFKYENELSREKHVLEDIPV